MPTYPTYPGRTLIAELTTSRVDNVYGEPTINVSTRATFKAPCYVCGADVTWDEIVEDSIYGPEEACGLDAPVTCCDCEREIGESFGAPEPDYYIPGDGPCPYPTRRAPVEVSCTLETSQSVGGHAARRRLLPGASFRLDLLVDAKTADRLDLRDRDRGAMYADLFDACDDIPF